MAASGSTSIAEADQLPAEFETVRKKIVLQIATFEALVIEEIALVIGGDSPSSTDQCQVISLVIAYNLVMAEKFGMHPP